MLATKWLVLQTNDIIVSTKMQTQVIIENHFIQEENILQTKHSFFYFVFKWKSFNDLDFAMVPLA